MGLIKDFKEFVRRGSAIDMAVGIIVGSVLTGVVNSLVKDILMPPIGLLIGGVDFSNWFVVINKGLDAMVGQHYSTVAAAQAAGAVTINIGLFLNTVISFFITMFAVFLFVRAANRIRGSQPATTRECPYCKSAIALAATKCPNCCSSVTPVKPPKTAEKEDDVVAKLTGNINKIVKKVKVKK